MDSKYILIALFLVFMWYYIREINEGFRPELAFMANKSKCFSCEKDAIRNYGIEYAWLGQPTKSFSAQSHRIAMAKNPMAGNLEASNSCPSCYWQYY